MIISHKHKFIFIKPTKVAGTSIEVNLEKVCSDNDIVTPISAFSKLRDSKKYLHKSRNDKSFYNHIKPNEIKKLVSKEIWKNYTKITIIRNPYDLVVSRFFWEKKRPKRNLSFLLRRFDIIKAIKNPKYFLIFIWKILSLPYNYYLLKRINNGDFIYFLKHYKKFWKNTQYYFDDSHNPICDYYLRFEHINEDYKYLCSQLNIEYEPLIKTKNNTREIKDYRNLYTPEAKKIVYELFKKEIDYFEYEF